MQRNRQPTSSSQAHKPHMPSTHTHTHTHTQHTTHTHTHTHTTHTHTHTHTHPVQICLIILAVIMTQPPDKAVIDYFHLEKDVGYSSIPLDNNGTCGRSPVTIVEMPNNTVASYGIYDEEGKKSSQNLTHTHGWLSYLAKKQEIP